MQREPQCVVFWSASPPPCMFQAPCTVYHDFISIPITFHWLDILFFRCNSLTGGTIVLFVLWELSWRFTHKVLCKSMFPLGVYLVVDLLDHETALHLSLTLRNWHIVFQSHCVLDYPHQQCIWVPMLLYSCQLLLVSSLLWLSCKEEPTEATVQASCEDQL